VFKEDFEQERRDREASRASMEHLDTKFREVNIELATTKKKVWHPIMFNSQLPSCIHCFVSQLTFKRLE